MDEFEFDYEAGEKEYELYVPWATIIVRADSPEDAVSMAEDLLMDVCLDYGTPQVR